MDRVAACLLASALTLVPSARAADTPPTEKTTQKTEAFKPESQPSKGAVTVEGRRFDYDAVAGTLIVHPRDWDDVPQNADKEGSPEASWLKLSAFPAVSTAAAGRRVST